MADHDGWNNNLLSYEESQWYFVIQDDGNIERLSEFFCRGLYPSAYMKEIGEYMIPACKPFLRSNDLH